MERIRGRAHDRLMNKMTAAYNSDNSESQITDLAIDNKSTPLTQEPIYHLFPYPCCKVCIATLGHVTFLDFFLSDFENVFSNPIL